MIADPERRLRTALAEQYGYYGRNESLLANVYRDAPLMQERLQAAGVDWEAVPEPVQRFSEQPARLRDALARGWQSRGRKRALLRAALALAIDFGTWRTLTQEQGLELEQAVELMTKLVVCEATRSDQTAR